MKKRFGSIFWLILSVLLIFSGSSSAQLSKKRQLKLYENGGDFDFSWSVEPKEREKMRSKLKDFVFTHLTEKKLARITTAFYTIEGDPFYSTVYIEPDSKGNWRIVEYWQRICCMLYLMEKKRRIPVKTHDKNIYESIDSYGFALRERATFL